MMGRLAQGEVVGRGRARLERARARGFLTAMGVGDGWMPGVHGFWCWRMRVPLVWCERKSPRSKFGRVHLDLFTTATLLGERGRAELRDLCDRLGVRGLATVSPNGGDWEDIPRGRAEELAGAVFRTATRPGNYKLQELASAAGPVRMRENKVLAIRMSA